MTDQAITLAEWNDIYPFHKMEIDDQRYVLVDSRNGTVLVPIEVEQQTGFQHRMAFDKHDTLLVKIDAVLTAMAEVEGALEQVYGWSAQGDFGWHCSRWQTITRRVEQFRDEMQRKQASRDLNGK